MWETCLVINAEYIIGTNRHQTYFATLDDWVSADNGVKLMDAFVDKNLDTPINYTPCRCPVV